MQKSLSVNIAVITAVALQLAAKAPIAVIGFENGERTLGTVVSGGISGNSPITGTASLLGDSTENKQDWFTFYQTDAKTLPLKAKGVYTVCFSYAIIDTQSADYAPVFLVRTAAGGNKEDCGWKYLRAPEAASGKKAITFYLGDFPDYQIILGCYKQGKVRFDDVKVYEGRVDENGDAVVLKPVLFKTNEFNEYLPSAPSGTKWSLVWNDEFNGATLDMSKWSVPEYKRRDAYWSKRAVSMEDDCLVISVFKEGERYYDAGIDTKGKFERVFGFFTVRIKWYGQPGHWGGAWLYTDNVAKESNATDGRNGTEIDIVEKPWLNDLLQNTLHWGGYGKNHKSAANVAAVLGVMEGFHTYSVWWTPTEYIFYTDNIETWRTNAGGVCQIPLHMILSDEVMKNGWCGDIDKAVLPDKMYIDYVRVYDLIVQH